MWRIAVLAVLILGGIGLYRGWFTVSESRPIGSDKVNVSVQVDRTKIRSDLGKVKAELKDEMASRAARTNP